MNSQTLLTVFVALTGLALLVQAVILLAVVFAAKKAADKLRLEFEEMRASAMPFLTAAREVMTRIAPKIEPVTADIAKAAANMSSVSTDLADISAKAREITVKVRGQVEGVDGTATAVLERFRYQAARVDSMVTRSLDAADRAGSFLETTVSAPARQVGGILAAVKAVIGSLRRPKPSANPVHPASSDNEDFV